MRVRLLQVVLGSLLAAGCAGQSAIKPAELLDERTGVTVGALQEPIELVASADSSVLAGGKRLSFAYLGPVEWDAGGDISYDLWFHVAPGNDKQVADIRSHDAVTLHLDGESVALRPTDPPKAGNGPYRPVASWGQTIYFELDVALLKRMAASDKLSVTVRAVDGTGVEFTPSRVTRRTLTQFLHARGITDD